jgi:hypothetical protein
MSKRFELRQGEYGPYFHDTQRGGKKGYDLTLADVLEKLNRLDDYTQRLRAEAEKKRD